MDFSSKVSNSPFPFAVAVHCASYGCLQFLNGLTAQVHALRYRFLYICSMTLVAGKGPECGGVYPARGGQLPMSLG